MASENRHSEAAIAAEESRAESNTISNGIHRDSRGAVPMDDEPNVVRVGEVVESGVRRVVLACPETVPKVGDVLAEELSGSLGVVVSIKEEPLESGRRPEPLGKEGETPAELRKRLPTLNLILRTVAEAIVLGVPANLGGPREGIPLHYFFRLVTEQEAAALFAHPRLISACLSAEIPDYALLALLADAPAGGRDAQIRRLVAELHRDWPRLRGLLEQLEPKPKGTQHF